MSKVTFRAKALDAGKPMPIFMAEELPDLPDCSAINRAVPQMPSGMEKEEECEHHLQRAIVTGLIIPTPEVTDITDKEAYEKLYPANYKQPRQLIHMQPFAIEEDIIDYDMDSEDERWLMSQTQRLELNPLKFEEMMDKLEKSSGQTVVTLNEAKALLKEDDDLIIALYDYWLNKRLKMQHPLIPQVKTEHRAGTAINNPYVAFRRRTEKMQTRKNRKNDESSYEKMLKLRRDLCRAVTLLELVKRREKIKREYVHLTIEVFEKRYQARDFSGEVIAELSSIKASRPAFTPIFHNHYSNQNWTSKATLKDEDIPRKEKRQYKKRKHKSSNHHRLGVGSSGLEGVAGLSSDEEATHPVNSEPEDVEEEGQFAFRRNKLCSYHMPKKELGNWPWCPPEENGLADKRYRYTLTSLSSKRCVGFARRRLGRGGRVILDRARTDLDDLWRTLDFTILEPTRPITTTNIYRSQPTATTTNTNYCGSGVEKAVKVEAPCSWWDGSGRPNQRTSGSVVDATAASDFIDRRGVVVSDGGGVSVSSSSNVDVKEEPADFGDEWSIPAEMSSGNDVREPAKVMTTKAREEQDEMVEFLKEVRRDWLHFRPKTPPPDYEPPCHLLPAEDDTFLPNSSTSFTLELQPLDAPPSSVLVDSSTFVTTPFTLDDLYVASTTEHSVPVTDTRQQHTSYSEDDLTRTMIGCSRFTVTEADNGRAGRRRQQKQQTNEEETGTHPMGMGREQEVFGEVVEDEEESSGIRPPSYAQSRQKHSFLLSTLTSPKANNVHTPPLDDRPLRHVSGYHPTMTSTSSTIGGGNTNGLLAQFSLNASTSDKMKINKLQPYAYISGEGTSTSPNQLSVRTSTHTHNTLNSHSANVLEIPMSDDTEKHSTTTTTTTPPTSATNNKNKSIVQKNNFIMEVT